MLANSQVISNTHNAKFGLYWFEKVNMKIVFTPRLTHTENIKSRVVKIQNCSISVRKNIFLETVV